MSAIALAAALSACITVQPSNGVPSTTTVQGPGYGYGEITEQPLQARLIPEYGTSSLSFALSRPAYVAVFEMFPGRGARLIYPSSFGQNQLTAAGYQRAMIFPATTHSLSGAYAGLDPYGWSSPWGNAGGSILGTPRYLYLVASEYPLSVTQFINSPLTLRSVLGFSSFEIGNPYVAFDRLTSAVVQPGTPQGSWTTDLYVDWPSTQRYPPTYAVGNRGYVAVRCEDGRVIYVPVGSTANLCPAKPAPPPGTVDTTHPKGTPTDSLRHRTGPVGPGSDDGVRRQPPPPVSTDEGRASRGHDLRVDGEPGQPVKGPPERIDPVEPRSSRPEAAPPRREPPRAEPPRAEPPRAEPPRAEPPRAEPPRASPPRATPARPAPVRVEPRPEPRPQPRAEPRPAPRAKPMRAEPMRAEPMRAEVSRPERSVPQSKGKPAAG